MNSDAVIVLSKLRKAKEEVAELEKEYRKVCECNEKIPGVTPKDNEYRKIYKTCSYHEVKIYHGINA